jgi:hypothetical protein
LPTLSSLQAGGEGCERASHAETNELTIVHCDYGDTGYSCERYDEVNMLVMDSDGNMDLNLEDEGHEVFVKYDNHV